MNKMEFVDVLVKAQLEINPNVTEQEAEREAQRLADEAEDNQYSYEVNLLVIGSQIVKVKRK